MKIILKMENEFFMANRIIIILQFRGKNEIIKIESNKFT